MASETAGSWEGAVEWLRQQPDHQALVKAAFFDDPLIDAATRYAASSEWRAVRAFLPKHPGRALDIGAGRGIASFALARDNWTVVALEPNPSVIVGAGAIRTLAHEGNLPIDVVETWGERLPFEEASFDVVHCRQVLHHARDLAQFCRESARVLKPGGVFLGTREHVISKSADLDRFLAIHPLQSLYGGEHAYRVSEYKAAIENAGLRLTQVLNPFASDINLYPDTKEDVRIRLARRLRWPWPGVIPDVVLTLLGNLKNDPGRLYSFAAYKAERA